MSFELREGGRFCTSETMDLGSSMPANSTVSSSELELESELESELEPEVENEPEPPKVVVGMSPVSWSEIQSSSEGTSSGPRGRLLLCRR